MSIKKYQVKYKNIIEVWSKGLVLYLSQLYLSIIDFSIQNQSSSELFKLIH